MVSIDGIDLPSGYSTIVNRTPVPGDVIISRVERSQGYNIWLSNSLGSVASVNEADGTALIHFSCDSLFLMSYALRDFVVIE